MKLTRPCGLFAILLVGILAVASCAPAAPPTPTPAPKPAAPAPTAAPAKPAAPAPAPTTAPAKPAAPAPTAAPAKPAAPPAQPAATAAPAKKSLGKITYLIGYKHTGDRAPFALALDKGYWSQEGLDVEVVEGKGGSEVLQLMGARPKDTTMVAIIDSPSTMLTASKGGPFKVLAMVFQRNPNGLVFRADSNIKTPKDLVGKKIGFSPGGTEGILAPAFLKANGVEMKDITHVSVDGAAKEQAFIARQVDVITSYVIGGPPRIKAAGGPDTRFFSYAEFGLPLMGDAIVTNQETIAQRPDAMRVIVKGTLDAFKYAKNRQDEAVASLLKHNADAKIDRVAALQTLKNAYNLIETPISDKYGWGYNDKELWQKMEDFQIQFFKQEKKATKIEDYYTNEFLPK